MSLSGQHSDKYWIRKESSRRPNQFYYFNTKTGKTQWTNPFGETSPLKSKDSTKNVKSKAILDRLLGVSKASKEITKSKTPAQDRLQNVKEILLQTVISPKVKVDSISKGSAHPSPTIYKLNGNKKLLSSIPDAEIGKKILRKDFSCQKTKILSPPIRLSQVKPKKPLPEALLKNEENNTSNAIEEIPLIFPPRTPAQTRLKALQQCLESKDSPKSRGNDTNAVLQVFQTEFGISKATSDNLKSVSFTNSCDVLNQDDEMDWESSFCGVTDSTKSLYIVPDTNVFLDGLECIIDVLQKDEKCCVLVPFVVLQELDRLKTNENGSLSLYASRAIKFIYTQLKSKNQRLQGQKAIDDNRNVMIDIHSPDDKVLNCCLQLKNQLLEVILVTNDINLSNKALTNGIEAITSKEYWKKFDGKP